MGHAKNFSIFLSPGGRFRMTPLYDVISAHPSVDSKQILWKQFRLAMAFGTKPHYQIRQIAPRHFFQTADQAGVGREVIESVVHELVEGGIAAVDSVCQSCQRTFPIRLPHRSKRESKDDFASWRRRKLPALRSSGHRSAHLTQFSYGRISRPIRP
jgi:serine/threonine protein kinase HipA of HipAB toxin-antitoxin module